jgi:hypothetical protein
MVELFTDAGDVESIKKEATQLWEWLEETTNKLWLILSRNPVYPVNITDRVGVLSREEIYKESFDRVRSISPESEFAARTLWLHVHMSSITDRATLDLGFALNNFYADMWVGGLSENWLSNPNILMTKDRLEIWKLLVQTRNKLWEIHWWFFPTKFQNKSEFFETFFDQDISIQQYFENIDPIKSHRIITLKKPWRSLTVEDRHADSPLFVHKICPSIDIIINNARQSISANTTLI